MSSTIAGAANSGLWSGVNAPQGQKMSSLFDMIDTTGSGSINKDQLGLAMKGLNLPAPVKNMGTDAVFARLDPKGSGSVSKYDFVENMKALLKEMRDARQNKSPDGAAAAALAASQRKLNTLVNGVTIGHTINITA